jgi:multisubunit Na+/H+ antiporter MnhF subunit
MACTTALLFAAAHAVARVVIAPNWAIWLGAVVMTVAFVAAFTILLGPTSSDRRVIIGRIRAMIAGLRPKTGG